MSPGRGGAEGLRGYYAANFKVAASVWALHRREA
jgi:hypothetical protein